MNTKRPQSEHAGNTQVKLRDRVLDRISKEGVEPIPWSLCVAKNSAFWLFFALSIFVGALSVATIIYTELNIGWELYDATHDNVYTFLIDSLPFAWLGVLVAVFVLGYYNVRQTKRGYRYPVWALALGSIFVSFVLGVYLHGAGYGKYVDETIGCRSRAVSTSAAWSSSTRSCTGYNFQIRTTMW